MKILHRRLARMLSGARDTLVQLSDARFVESQEAAGIRQGAHVLARLVSEKSPNTFPRLPVREDVDACVWFGAFADRAAYDAWLGRLARDVRWRDTLFGQLRKSLARSPEVLMLAPTARSQLRGAAP